MSGGEESGNERKDKHRKVIMYKGVKIESEDEKSGSNSEGSNDSAEEFFNMQR